MTISIRVSPNDVNRLATFAKRYSPKRRRMMAMEECAEAIAALSHFDRGREGGREEVIEEAADAVVAIADIVFNEGWWEEFHKALHRSMEKIAAKIAEDNHNEGDEP